LSWVWILILDLDLGMDNAELDSWELIVISI
jgi:hypothetical protein